MSSLVGAFLTREEFMNKFPPGATYCSNFSSDGSFITTTSVACEITGEPTGSSETTTEQFAEPPRISGP